MWFTPLPRRSLGPCLILLLAGSAATQGVCGDCNADGLVTIIDALVAAQHAAGLITVVPPQFESCNVEGTPGAPPAGVISILDALRIAQACAGLPAAVLACGARVIANLSAVSALGASGAPSLVPGSAGPGNPRGDWQPLGEGIFSENPCLSTGGNPVLFISLQDPPVQIVLQADCTGAPLQVDVAPAVNAEGTTSYQVLAGGGFVTVTADGLLAPAAPNGCTTFRATFVPGGVTLGGSPATVDFAACVDLGGIDGATRVTELPVGSFDADIPGLPLGDPIVGPGGTVTETVYVNVGATSIGAYQLNTTWDSGVLELDQAVGLHGVTGSSIPALGGPTVVNAAAPGFMIANHFTTSAGITGVLDIWTLHFRVLAPGTTLIDHEVEDLVSGMSPIPVAIGPPTPRAATEASTTPGAGITIP